MVNKKIDEAVFDVLLEHAFLDVIEEDMKKLQNEAEPCTISAETEQEIRKMVSQVGKREKPKAMRVGVRVASIVLIVLLNVSLIGLLMVPSINAEVTNVFADWFDKYVSYENKEQDSYVVTTSEYEIGYIPKGFELILNDDKQVLFREIDQGKGYISINISYEDFGHVSVDTEESITKIIKINHMNGTLQKFDNDYLLFWYDGYYFISINANIVESELLKVAQNIKKFQ